MNKEFQTQNASTKSELDKFFRQCTKDNQNSVLKILNDNIKWDDIRKLVDNNMSGNSDYKLNDPINIIMIKAIVIGKLFNLTDYQLPFEIAENNNFKNFLDIKYLDNIPKIKTISAFRRNLENNNVYDKLFDSIYDYLMSAKEGLNLFVKKDNAVAKKIELTNKINSLYGEKLDNIFSNSDGAKVQDMKNKLLDLKSKIENISVDDSTENSTGLQKLTEMEKKIDKLEDVVNSTENDKIKYSEENELHKKIFESFYKSLDELTSLSADDKNTGINSTSIVSKDSAEFKVINKISRTGKTNIITDYIIDIPNAKKVQVKEQVEVNRKNREPIIITPKFKKEGIFNDENLTEDYELGFRFFQIGFKTGFFNVKLDNNNESTRISTAEFFPNTFWTSVKQRSRWIAGISLQNWKTHKWKGNITTKYFLFRDRKSIFSFIGAFLSNIIFAYLIYSVFCGLFHVTYVVPLVGFSSVIWYLMIANLLFMISRATHRFFFTYNWYGFKYAFFSFFRLIIDTFINFFAIIRAFKVFRQTKKKVVWDATTHY